MVTIKPEFKNYTRISFKGSRKPLGQRSNEELAELALLAQSSNDKSLLKVFDKLPGLEQLKKMKTDKELLGIVPDVKKESVKTPEKPARKRKTETPSE